LIAGRYDQPIGKSLASIKKFQTIWIEEQLSVYRTYVVISLMILAASMIEALALSKISRQSISKPILDLAETARVVSRVKDYSVRATMPKESRRSGASGGCVQRNAAGDSETRFGVAGKRTTVQDAC
jgi:methyl-accepting chemotaxis protein